MKRMAWIIMPVVIGLMVANVDAQTGVTGGVNISNLNGIGSATTRNGVIAGVFTEYGIVPGLALQPEVLFSVKGASSSNQSVAGPVPAVGNPVPRYDLTLDYVEVPVLLKLMVLDIPILPANVDVYAGPDFAFNVASNEKTSYAGVTTTTDETKNIRPFDFNIAVGGGPNLDLGSMTVGAEVRYTFGTSPVLKNQNVTNVFNNAKNGVWSIMASVGF